MDRPLNITIPILYADNTAPISWSSVEGATIYQLDRKTDIDFDFVKIYEGTETSFTDYIPLGVTTAVYQVMAASEWDYSWNESDELDQNWNSMDAADWAWFREYSNFTTSETKEVIPNRPPTISGQDTDMGIVTRGFIITFSVTDPDPNNTIDIIAGLDGALIFNMPNAQQGTNYEIPITDDQIFAMEDQSQHTITIAATDNKGAIATRIYTFTVLEDLLLTAVFYVLRDGAPVARLESVQEWTDYLEVGTHRYVIRGIDRYDNYSDSNEVLLTISMKYATIAAASAPDNYISLIMRRNERPQESHNYNVQYTETRFEGRQFPVYSCTGQRGSDMPLAYSTRTLQEQKALFSLIDYGEPLVFRDQYNNRIIGIVPDLGKSFQGRFFNQLFDAFVDFDIIINQCDYRETVDYD